MAFSDFNNDFLSCLFCEGPALGVGLALLEAVASQQTADAEIGNGTPNPTSVFVYLTYYGDGPNIPPKPKNPQTHKRS